MKLTDEQEKERRNVVTAIISGNSCCFTGAAGTGKTTTLQYIIHDLEKKFKVSSLSPTHQACSVLRDIINRPVGTVASALKKKKEIDLDTGQVLFNPSFFTNNQVGVIIIDESSMLGSQDVLTFATNYPKSIFLFVGDKYQLPPVNDEDFCIFDYFPTFELKTNMRCGKGNALFDLIEDVRKGQLNINFTGNVHKAEVIDGEIPIICYYNETRRNWNNLILEKRTGGVINEKVKFIANENIGYNKNTNQYDIKNGVTFFPISVSKKQIVITDKVAKNFKTEYYLLEALIDNRTVKFKYLDQPNRDRFLEYLEQFKNVDWLRYYKIKDTFPDIDLAYSITSHKSQGSTFQEAIVDLNDFLKVNNQKIKNASLYVALSRSKDRVHIIC